MHNRKDAIKIYSWWKGDVVGELVNTFSTRVADDGGVVEATDCLATRIQTLRSKGLWNRASAVWLPHAYKESKLYAVKGGSGVDLGFSRAGIKYRQTSSLVEQVPYNLLQYSEQFDNAAWTKSGTTITANAIANPIDGLLTADKILETATTAVHQVYINQLIRGAGECTLSVYAKAAERNWISLNIQSDSTVAITWFDLSNGVVGTNAAGNTATITALEDGWYRCSITRNAIASTANFYPAIRVDTGDNIGTYLGVVTNGIYVFGAQFNNGSVRDYLKTTDRFNVPSLDYTGSACPALSLEPARTNLCLRSQEFDNATWAKGGATITANDILAPDGTLTAGKLLETAPSAAHQVNQTFTKAASVITYTASVYMRGGLGRDWGQFAIGAGSNAVSGYYNLTTGTVGSAAAAGVGYTVISSSMVACTNGWYRCILTFTTDTGTSISWPIRAAESDGVVIYVGDITKGVYLWGAQLEVGSYATSYIPTTSATVARIADSVPALLPKGTNQLLQSQTLDNASWPKTAVTVTANAINAPDATLTADRIVETGLNQGHYIGQTITKAATSQYFTLSVYTKIWNGRDWIRLDLTGSGSNGIRAWFDISNGVKGVSPLTGTYGTGWGDFDSSITAVGDGWYRCTISGFSDTSTSLISYLQVVNSDGGGAYLGEITKGIYFWGAQLEQGDEATTYVATTTAPVHNGTVIGQTEGTIFMELSSFADSTVKALFGISDGTVNNRILVYLDSTNVIIGNLQNAGVQQAQILSSTFTTGTNYKIALTYQNNKVALFVNGVKIGEDLTATIPTMNQIRFDNGGGGSVNYSLGKCYSLLTTALTDAEAITLTTP